VSTKNILLEEIDEKLSEMELMTRAAYARRVDVAARTIGKYCQKGVIPLHNDMINPDEADAALKKYLVDPIGSGKHDLNTGKLAVDDGSPNEEGAGGRKQKLNNIGYTEARTEEKKLKIELLELEVSLRKGQMVLTKDVEFAAFTAAREIRDRMLNIPDRVAAIVAAETDEVTVRDIITEHIENELTSLIKEKYNLNDLEEE
jgi:phage terminase Nu1 subunit (DNA packaging protein)